MKYSLIVGGEIIRSDLAKSKAFDFFNLLSEVITDGRDISVIYTMCKKGDVYE